MTTRPPPEAAKGGAPAAAQRVDPMAELLHELDTPLGVALTAASIQEQRLNALTANAPVSNAMQARLLADVRESARLVRNGLDRAIAVLANRKAARRGQAQPAADPQPLDVVLGDALSVPLFRFRDRNIACELDVEEGLIVQTEPQAWYQVMTNLVTNSAHHGFVCREDSGCIRVSAGRLGPDRVRVVYRDNGRGFSAHARSTAFVRQYTTRPDGGSSGLGLCIVRDIVRDRLHGGIELLDSDEGAAFAIYFPTRQPILQRSSPCTNATP